MHESCKSIVKLQSVSIAYVRRLLRSTLLCSLPSHFLKIFSCRLMKCLVRPDPEGLGNMCLTEHMINLSDSTLCVYQRTAEKTLHPNLSEAGVAGVDSQVLQWLLDTRFSGKSVRLALGTDFIAEVETKNSLTIRFRLTRALQTLRDGGTSIQIQATQDLTSSEILDVPIQVVSTAPRPIIHVNSGMQPEYSFLLPQFSPLDTRSDYAMCGGRSDISHLGASVTDVRFEVVHTDVQEPSSCHSQQPDQRRMFRSVRRKDSGCGRWCEHYIPRAETYDIVVDRSPKECYMMAVSLQDVDALRNTRVMTAGAGLHGAAFGKSTLKSLSKSDSSHIHASLWFSCQS